MKKCSNFVLVRGCIEDDEGTRVEQTRRRRAHIGRITSRNEGKSPDSPAAAYRVAAWAGEIPAPPLPLPHSASRAKKNLALAELSNGSPPRALKIEDSRVDSVRFAAFPRSLLPLFTQYLVDGEPEADEHD